MFPDCEVNNSLSKGHHTGFNKPCPRPGKTEESLRHGSQLAKFGVNLVTLV